MEYWIQVIIDGLLTGSIYATIAVGLSLSFGVMRVFNWAHGEFFMMAMYLSFVVIKGLNMNPYLAAVIVVPLMVLVAWLVQKFLLNPLIKKAKDREVMSVLITTAGLSYILENLATLIFTANSKSVTTFVTGKSINIGDIYISIPKIVAMCCTIMITLGLQYFLNKTRHGRALKCTSQDREVAQLMGMNNWAYYCLALCIGFACIGWAACETVSMYSIIPTLGATFGFKSLVVVVLGGKGSVTGALLGGLIVGVVEAIGGSLLNMNYAQMFIFAVFIIVLVFKPNGLLSNDRG